MCASTEGVALWGYGTVKAPFEMNQRGSKYAFNSSKLLIRSHSNLRIIVTVSEWSDHVASFEWGQVLGSWHSWTPFPSRYTRFANLALGGMQSYSPFWDAFPVSALKLLLCALLRGPV